MTQTIPGWAARDGVGHAPTLLETVPGGHLVAKARETEGADTVHTRCGGHIIDSYDSCTDDGSAVVDPRHEQVAALALAAAEQRLARRHSFAAPMDPYRLVTEIDEFPTENPIYVSGSGAPALQRARRPGLPSLINVWIDPEAYAPGTTNQTMYK